MMKEVLILAVGVKAEVFQSEYITTNNPLDQPLTCTPLNFLFKLPLHQPLEPIVDWIYSSLWTWLRPASVSRA